MMVPLHLFCLFSVFLSGFLWGKEISPYQPKKYKYELSVCAVVRNEAKYIKEWIEFHRLIGVNHFYLYNNNSKDRLYITLYPYIKKGIVTLIQWPDYLGEVPEDRSFLWSLSTQIPAFENAIILRAANQTKWLALLNIDEYLVPIQADHMRDLLKEHSDAPAILLTTDIFDASSMNLFPYKNLVIESCDLIKAPKQNPHKTFSKMIFQPKQYAGFTWPPYQVVFKHDAQPVEIKRDFLRINHYVNRGEKFVSATRHKLYIDSNQLSYGELSSLLDQDYMIEDREKIILKYLPALRQQFE